jgi:hypothetical protein
MDSQGNYAYRVPIFSLYFMQYDDCLMNVYTGENIFAFKHKKPEKSNSLRVYHSYVGAAGV